MDANEHERLSNFTLGHTFKKRNSAFVAVLHFGDVAMKVFGSCITAKILELISYTLLNIIELFGFLIFRF